MFVLWANWHIQFVYGLFVLRQYLRTRPILNSLAKELVGYTATRPKSSLPAKQTWLVLAASALATLLNPYGWKLYSTVFLYMGQTVAYNTISELRAMTFREPQHFLALLLALGAALTIGWRRDARPLWLIHFSPASLGLGVSVGARSVVSGNRCGRGNRWGIASRRRSEAAHCKATKTAIGGSCMRSGGPRGVRQALRSFEQLAGYASRG